MKMRRILGILTLIALALAAGWWLLADAARRDRATEKKSETIRFAHCGGIEDAQFWRQTLADFEKANPNIRVMEEFDHLPGDQCLAKLRGQILDDTLADVVLVPMIAFQELSGSFEPLAGHNEKLEPAALKAFEVQGEQRGLPFSGGNLLIFLNRKSFQKASDFHGKPVPIPDGDWTVAEFLRTAEMLTCDINRDGETDQFGFRLPRWLYYLPFIWSFGADITDAQATRWTFSGPTAQSVMRFYRQLATGDRVAPREDDAPQSFQDAGFLSGKTAMCVNGPWFIAILNKTELANDYAVAPIPRGPGGQATRITWDGIAIRKNLPAERRDRARRFVEWTLSKEVQERLARSGRAIPARLDAHEAFVAADPPRRKPFIDALSYSRVQPPLPRFESLDRAITRHFEEAIDPNRAFEAMTMLDALARDPAVVGAFAQSTSPAP